MKYQQLFASMFSRPPPRRGLPTLSAAELSRLSLPLWAFSRRLGLPHLEPWQRKELGEADVPELRSLMLAYGQLLAARPDLAKALRITPAFVEGLRRKEVALGGLVEMLEQLLRAVSDIRLCAVAELHHLNQRVAAAAERLREDGAIDAAERDAELAGFASVARLRSERLQARRKLLRKAERRMRPLRAQLDELRGGAEPPRVADEPPDRPAQPERDDGAAPVEIKTPARRSAPRARWIGGDRAEALIKALRRGGSPLESCLGVDADEIDACAAEVGRVKARLGAPTLSAEERRELGGRDAVVESNLAMANAQALRTAPRIAASAGEAQLPAMLEDGCRALLALDRLELGADLLLRDALDGRAVAVGMVALLHQEALRWLEQALGAGEHDEAERQRLLADFAGPLGLAQRAEERREAQAARARRRLGSLAAEVQAAARKRRR